MRWYNRELPSREVLTGVAERVPELNVSAVQLLLQILQVANEIQHHIYDVLEKKYKLSEGKLAVMIILYIAAADGISPSQLADKAGVTRATISAMLHRLSRDGLATSFSDSADGRGKVVSLTPQGRRFMEGILPDHYLRIAQMMNKLDQTEQAHLVRLLKKMNAQ